VGRPASGSVLVYPRADGSRAFRLRFRALGARRDVWLHDRPDCECGCGGAWDEPGARRELANVLARVRAGVWRPVSAPEPVVGVEVPTFHVFASRWLSDRVAGVTGDRPIRPSTASGYRTALSQHLLPFFARYRLDEIDRQLCLAFKGHKLREAAELREAIAAGADLRDRRNRRLVPLSLSSVRKLIGVLAMVLDDAVEDDLIDRNPARGKRMRIHGPKPKRSFLELDELRALLEAAASQDALPAIPPAELAGSTTRTQVARRTAAGEPPSLIARELGLAKATVSFHLRGLGVCDPVGYIGRHVVIELLARTGLRASELCNLHIADVRLHDPEGPRLHVTDSKTQAGIREVQLTPDLTAAIRRHLERLRVAGQPTAPDAYLVPNRRGGRLARQRLAAIVSDAAELANERREAAGLPALPHVTPHSLRRTYISLALLANNYDVKWVMAQVGHANSTMTLDVYAQLQHRAPRHHPRNLDRLLNDNGLPRLRVVA
jgi:integrase